MKPIRIVTLTWNVNGQTVPEDWDVSNLFSPQSGCSTTQHQDEAVPDADLVVVGLQEVSSGLSYVSDWVNGADPWTQAISSYLCHVGYIRIRSVRLMGIVLSVFCLKSHLLHIRYLDTQYTRLGFPGWKGCVSVRLNLFGVSVCLVNCHLSALDHRLQQRIDDFHTICNNHTFNYPKPHGIKDHAYVIWMGDFNFRLDSTEEWTFDFNKVVQSIESGQLDRLLAVDELNRARQKKQAFSWLQETPPSFPPTYKFILGSDTYDSKRRPAWTDRVLYYVDEQRYGSEVDGLDLRCVSYRSLQDRMFWCSDHRPVSATFVIQAFKETPLLRQVGRGGGDLDPLVEFTFPPGSNQEEQLSWALDEDGRIEYRVLPGAQEYLGCQDFIALYRANFTVLDQYLAFCWASNSSEQIRTVSFPAEAICAEGSFVLVYMAHGGSVMAMTRPFSIRQRPNEASISGPGDHGPGVEVGLEAHEHLD